MSKRVFTNTALIVCATLLLPGLSLASACAPAAPPEAPPAPPPVAEKALVAGFTYAPTELKVGVPVKFTDETTGGLPPYSYEWDLNGDTVPDHTVANPPPYTYDKAATYLIVLTVRDSAVPANEAYYQVFFKVTGE